MTIPTERTRPMPTTYQQATIAAIQNRQQSIQSTRAPKDPLLIEVSSTFWYAEGFKDTHSSGLTSLYFSLAPKPLYKSTGNIEALLYQKFDSHTDMMRQIIEQCLTVESTAIGLQWSAVQSV